MVSTPRKTPTTTRKRSTTTSRAKASAPVEAPEPTVVAVSDPVVAEADLKKKELIDLVVERSGVKKKWAKPTVEAMLAVLGETINSGRELNLQPLGKLRINRTEEKANGRVIICKLRQSLSGSDDDMPDNDDDMNVQAAE
ncbi:HU family DNA-binding protein [Phaeobacter marinintestinus]|uniref:HU family DNA-binding protein n=1 Tax=Falsiphaeobacter marinintestinus TaxID=1492905 RepID=UPI0011B3573B|nr:HU family DNA-binding protein [Phaeobacter marinintestinus]